MYKLISGIVAGLCLLIGAAINTSYTRDFLRHSVVVPGRVVAQDYGPNHPKIEFVTLKGSHISRPQGGFLPATDIGDVVPVRYRPHAPLQSATLDYFWTLWGEAFLLLLVGIACLIGSAVNFYLLKRQNPGFK
jgi:hypothetical protein